MTASDRSGLALRSGRPASMKPAQSQATLHASSAMRCWGENTVLASAGAPAASVAAGTATAAAATHLLQARVLRRILAFKGACNHA